MAQATSSDGQTLGFKWENATTAVQYTVAKPGAIHGGCDKAETIARRIIGVIQNAPATGEMATVMIEGKSLCVGDGGTVDIAIGDLLMVDSSGRAIKAQIKATVVATETWVLGHALQACTETNYVFEVLVRPRLVTSIEIGV